MSPLPVLYSFARSGGTLANQLLGSHPQCLVLSEVNPAGSFKPVVDQAVEWLGLATAGEAAEMARLPYHRQISQLRERAQERGKRLFVRDWVTVNFLPGTVPEITAPSGELEQVLYLARAGLRPEGVVVTRRAAAAFESIRRTFPHLAGLDPATFARAYLRYARAVAGLPVVHMEKLRAEPYPTLLDLLRFFDLDHSNVEAILGSFADFRNCTGNTTLGAGSRSASARDVLPPDDPSELEMQLAATHPELGEADRLLGYAH